MRGSLTSSSPFNNPPNVPDNIGYGNPLWYVNALAVDVFGNVYASCYDTALGISYISRTTQNESSVWVMGIGGSALACDPAGNLYSVNGNIVTEISTNQLISTYATCTGAVSIAFDQNTNLFFATSTNVQVIAPGGTCSLRGNLTGTAVSQALALDNAGNVYVATSLGIEKITPSGSDTIFFSWTNVQPGLFIDETNAYIYFYYIFGVSHAPSYIARVSLSPPGILDASYSGGGGNYNGTMAYSPFDPVQGPIPAVPVDIEQQPSSTTNNAAGSATFTVDAVGTLPISYQWVFNGTFLLGATNSTLTLTNINSTNVGNYYVVVSNQGSSVVSSNATLYMVIPPVITVQPQSQITYVDDTVSFTVQDVSITPETYQWVFNGTNIVGATSSTFTIQDAEQEDLGSYSVIVSNFIGATVSDIATLQMYPFLSSPYTGTVAIWGTDASLSVSSGGTGPFTYQWFENSLPINGGTNQTLTISSIQFTNAGLYSVVVNSPYGSITNAAYQVVVNPANVSLGFYPGLTISGVVGYSYIIQSSTNLGNTNGWLTLTNLTLTQPVQLFIDTTVDASSPFNSQHFYQVLPGQ